MAKKTLTNAARQILMKESNDAAPDRDAKSTNPNKKTLQPGSRYKENQNPVNPNSTPVVGDAEDLGPAIVDANQPASGPAVANKAVGKDTSGSSQSRIGTVAGEIRKSLSEDDVKELDKFIAEKLEEGLTEEEVEKEIHETFEFVPENDDEIVLENEEGNEDDEIVNEDSDLVNEDEEVYQPVDMKEHVDALLEGEELSEEFREKAQTIFEAAVNAKLAPEIERLKNIFENRLLEEVARIEEELEENVNDFVTHVVENWMKDNEVAIESGLRTEITEEFISGLKNLFEENFIDVPEDKVNVVEEMSNRVAELENKLNEQIEIGVEQTKKFNELKKEQIVAETCSGLADTQKEKLKSLSEGVDFTNETEFKEKLNTLRESYFPTTIAKKNTLDEIEGADSGKKLVNESDNRMEKYTKALGRTLPK